MVLQGDVPPGSPVRSGVDVVGGFLAIDQEANALAQGNNLIGEPGIRRYEQVLDPNDAIK